MLAAGAEVTPEEAEVLRGWIKDQIPDLTASLRAAVDDGESGIGGELLERLRVYIAALDGVGWTATDRTVEVPQTEELAQTAAECRAYFQKILDQPHVAFAVDGIEVADRVIAKAGEVPA